MARKRRYLPRTRESNSGRLWLDLQGRHCKRPYRLRWPSRWHLFDQRTPFDKRQPASYRKHPTSAVYPALAVGVLPFQVGAGHRAWPIAGPHSLVRRPLVDCRPPKPARVAVHRLGADPPSEFETPALPAVAVRQIENSIVKPAVDNFAVPLRARARHAPRPGHLFVDCGWPQVVATATRETWRY